MQIDMKVLNRFDTTIRIISRKTELNPHRRPQQLAGGISTLGFASSLFDDLFQEFQPATFFCEKQINTKNCPIDSSSAK